MRDHSSVSIYDNSELRDDTPWRVLPNTWLLSGNGGFQAPKKWNPFSIALLASIPLSGSFLQATLEIIWKKFLHVLFCLFFLLFPIALILHVFGDLVLHLLFQLLCICFFFPFFKWIYIYIYIRIMLSGYHNSTESHMGVQRHFMKRELPKQF